MMLNCKHNILQINPFNKTVAICLGWVDWSLVLAEAQLLLPPDFLAVPPWLLPNLQVLL